MESGYKRRLRGCLIRVGELSLFFPFLCDLPRGIRCCGWMDLFVFFRYGYTHTDEIRYSMISYPNYKFYFPIKALGMYMKWYGDEELL